VREYNEKVECIHMNPARAGLARCAEEWLWSSVHDYTRSLERPVATPSGLEIDRVLLPADEDTRIRGLDDRQGRAAEERKRHVPLRYLLGGDAKTGPVVML
jgi:hypothetical protein